MAKPLPLTAIKGGINRLRIRGGASPQALYDLVNGWVTVANTVKVREGTIRNTTLDGTTVGLAYFKGSFNVFSTAVETVPEGYTCNVLINPDNADDTLAKIWFAQPFLGFLYVVAEFASGDVFHYWLQSQGEWTADTVYQNGAIVTPTTPNGLAYQATRVLAPNTTWTPETSITEGQIVEPTVANGYYFTATTVEGDSPHTGQTEPTWPSSPGATVQEFGDFVANQGQLTSGGSTTSVPLSQSITDRYGDSETIAGNASTSTAGAVTALPTASSTVSTWKKGTLYQPGAVVVPSTNQGAVVNAIPNGDFNAGDDGSWDFGGSGTAWQITTGQGFVSGDGSAFVPPGSTSASLTMHTAADVTPGQKVTATCYMTTGTSSGSDIIISFGFNWYESDGTTLISSTDSGGYSSHGYTLRTVTGTAPAGAAKVKLYFHAASGTSDRDTGRVSNVSWNLATPAAISNFLFEAVQAAAATSGSTEPAWPTTEGDTVVDGGVTWQAVGSSIITWTATPIMKSGGSEPTWPLTVGQSVSDGTMAWTAISRQITDPHCPNTTGVAIGESHVFAVDDDIVAYSAAVDPTDWSTPNNAGYLPTGLNTYGANPMTTLALYRGNLMAFNSAGYQMWQIDPDPANMALLDAQPVGSTFVRSAQSVANDLLVCTVLGVRNIGTTGATANLSTGQLGQPIDVLVQDDIANVTDEPISLYYPAKGQYWLIFNNEAFVLTVNGNSQKSWSRYIFPDAITDWTLNGETLYLRTSNNLVWKLDASTLVDDYHLIDSHCLLLCHFDGGDGSEVFTDSSSYGNTINSVTSTGFGTWTAGGGQQSNAEVKFGASSFISKNDPSGGGTNYQNAQIPWTAGSLLDISRMSAFTVEMFFFPTTNAGTFWSMSPANADPAPSFYLEWVSSSGGTLILNPNVGSGYPSLGAAGVTVNEWHHVAVVLSGGVVKLYVDGTLAQSGNVGTIFEPTLGSQWYYYVGQGVSGEGGGNLTYTYVDELRISNVARYSGSSYTVPTSPFTDAGTDPVFTEFTGTMQWPYLSLGAFGYNDMMTGFDLVGTGDVTVSFGFDETNLGNVTAGYELTAADTLPGQPIGFPVNAPSVSLILSWAGNQAWEWQAANLYSNPLPNTG